MAPSTKELQFFSIVELSALMSKATMKRSEKLSYFSDLGTV